MRHRSILAVSLLATSIAVGCSASPEATTDGAGASSQSVTVQDPGSWIPDYDQVIKYGTKATVTPGKDKGEVVIDSTNGAVILDAPSAPLSFASMGDFVAYAEKNLFVRLRTDANGNVTGVEGEVEQLGPLVTLDPKARTVSLVSDPIAALLGGAAGYVLVEGKPHCLTSACAKELGQEAPIAQAKPLFSHVQCDGSHSLCVTTESYITSVLNYREMGGSTTVVYSGGFDISCLLASWFPGFFASCGTAADLGVSTTFIKNSGARWGAISDAHSNVTRAHVQRWGIDFWFFKANDGDVFDSSGVCSRHFARRGNLLVADSTTEGDTHGACP